MHSQSTYFNKNLFLFFIGEYLTSAGYNQWGDNEPNNHEGIELCGTLDSNGKLNDYYCTRKKIYYICEFDPYV